ncbi:MAG: S-methyl-5-thioribose-1-phosphate isomerase, partial [Bacteroidales bacterium]|nr:S-methyl-5-thioribose-1-phosphate isomerase [Bacteroidales bacterium]
IFICKGSIFLQYMKVQDRHFETIWLKSGDPETIQVIDQRFLPFDFKIEDIATAEDMYTAIREMHVRGAPLIGIAGAFGLYLALLNIADHDEVDSRVRKAAVMLKSARPTAVNLAWAVDRVLLEVEKAGNIEEKKEKALETARQIIDEERISCLKIGEYGLKIIEEISRSKRGQTVNILTHCNAGWLACIDYGTATAPVYLAHDRGIKVHVVVDETRPRNQGARLTCWELQQHGVPYTLIVDNAGGHMMQRNMIDLVIVGSDRVSPYGDVVNKIGTYLKALAARDNHIPFYAALPSSSIDWNLQEGAYETPIEERDGHEVRHMEGMVNECYTDMLIVSENTPVANFGFDITPARLVTGLITEKGIAGANYKSIMKLFPEKNKNLFP